MSLLHEVVQGVEAIGDRHSLSLVENRTPDQLSLRRGREIWNAKKY